MGRALLKSLACGGAGALAWLLCEPFFPKQVLIGKWNSDPAFTRVELVFTFLLGALIGLVSGFLSGRERGGRSNIVTASLLGLIFGAMGSTFGQSIAAAIYSGMGGGSDSAANVLARTMAFIPLGAAMGAAVGASQRSLRTFKSGALGGAIAGLLTGAVFDLLSNVLSRMVMPVSAANIQPGYEPEGGAPGRALMAFGMGLLIGLFTALVDLATRKAWLRLVLGRNEGKEWPIDAAQTLIGRDERAHVPLFGDPQVPHLAAVIVRQGNQYILQDPNSPIGVGHNGVRVQQANLSPGDTIQIGNLNFQFMMKAGSHAASEGRHKGVPIGGGFSAPAQPMQPIQPVHAPGANQTMSYQPIQPSNQTIGYAPQAAPVASPNTLVVTNGPLAGQRIPVISAIEVGREGSGLALGYDAQASRKHASLTVAPGGVQVTDLGSTNGTYVNGQRVPNALLRPGDVLTIGSTSFKVE